jgi:hypothetical protein
MSQKQQDWLVHHLVSNGFCDLDMQTLEDRVSGMTAIEIIDAMEEAKLIRDRLNSTLLGKELN